MKRLSIDWSTVAVAILALIAGLLAAWPPLHLVLVNANLASYYQENIGWRFFWTQRFWEGVPGDFVHPAQGVLFTLIQSLFYLSGKFLGLDLFGQIDLFGKLTIVVAAISLMVLGLLIALDRKLDAGVRAAFVATPLVMGVGGPQIFAYDLYPDYLAYAKVLFLVFGWRWVHHRAWQAKITSRGARELGFLTGLIGAFKINYVVWPGGLLLYSLIVVALDGRRAAGRIGMTMAMAAAVSFLGPFLLFYRGHIGEIWLYFRSLVNWTSSLSGSLEFSTSVLASEASLARVILVLGIVCLLQLARFRLKPILLVLVLVILAGFAVGMAYWRGGGSSYFDAVVMVTVLCVIATATFEYRAMVRVTSIGVALVFVIWPMDWTASHWREYTSVEVSGHESLLKLGEAGDWQRGLYNWNVSQGLPVYVLTPTNYEAQGTIEDMIFMGFQNFAGAPPDYLGTLKALYPHLHFLYYESASYHPSLPSERVVFMRVVGKPAPDFPQLDQGTLNQHEVQVDRLLRGRHPEQCYTVKQILTHVDIVSCVISAPE